MGERRLGESEFWELYSKSQSHLVRFARRLTSDRLLAEDAVSEAGVAVLKTLRNSADGGPTRATFISYMRVCVRHEVARLARKFSREEATGDIEHQIEEQQSAFGHEGTDADLDIWDAEVAQRAFKALPARDQVLLRQTEIEGRSHAEVGHEHGMAAGTVAVAVFRARDTLRTNYLVEAVTSEPSCGNMREDFLAAYVRGRSPALRRKRVEGHLSECPQCAARANVMMRYRVPGVTILVLAAGGGFYGTGSGAVEAASVLVEELKRETAALASALNAKRVLLVGVGVVVLIAIGLSAWFWGGFNQTLTRGGERESARTAVQGDPSTADPTSKPRTGTEAPDTSPPTKPDGDTRSGENEPPKTNPPKTNPPKTEPPKTNPPKTEPPVPPLPPGVRSVQWHTAPPAYQAGGRGVKLLLEVEFDPGTKPSNYEVLVDLPVGVSVTQASAGCSIAATSVVCTPTSDMLSLKEYNFQFFVDVSNDVPLPKAAVQKR